MMPKKELMVSCSCGTATHTFAVPLSSLPLPSHLCNCDISRRISGSLLTSYINITHSLEAPKPDISNLTAYDSSDILRRWFCSTCGTHMYLEYHSDGHFEAATGTLQVDKSDRIVQFESMMWIGDTGDGGASEFITHMESKKLLRFVGEAGQSEEIPLGWSSDPLTKTIHRQVSGSDGDSESEKSNAVHAHCHCRGVEFWITPPSHPSSASLGATQTSSPFPDLTHPHYTKNPQAYNPGNVHWWTPNSTHWLAGTCMCPSCRAASGFDITFWAFIPTSHIFLDANCTVPFPSSVLNTYWGTIKTHVSSPGVTRSFCSACGANVFWHGDEETFGRKGLVDVAVGLLDAKSGSKAEEMLEWYVERVSFGERALHQGLRKVLEEGLIGYGERKGRCFGR
jgi:hypothetical protein